MFFFDFVVFWDILSPFLSVLIQNYQAGYKRTSECNYSGVHMYIGFFLTNLYLQRKSNFLAFRIFKMFSRVQSLILLIRQSRKKYENNVKGSFEDIMPLIYLDITFPISKNKIKIYCLCLEILPLMRYQRKCGFSSSFF